MTFIIRRRSGNVNMFKYLFFRKYIVVMGTVLLTIGLGLFYNRPGVSVCQEQQDRRVNPAFTM